MGVLQVGHIRSFLEAEYLPLLDASDLSTQAPEDRHLHMLSRSLAAFALSSLTGCDGQVVSAAVVDGFDDNGIDAVHFDAAEHLLYVIQSKWISSGSGTPDRGEVQLFIKGVRDLVEPRLERFNAKLQAKAPEILQALGDVSVGLVLVIAHTGQQALSSHAQSDLDDLLVWINDTSEACRVRVLNQKDLHTAVASKAKGEGISVELLLREWGHTKDPYGAYYGQVDAGDLATLWKEHGPALLAQNLRKFIGSSDVNEVIMETLRETPERFWYYNNGVTALCSSISKKPIGGSKRGEGVFVCEDFSIVNGGQTVGAIGTVSEKWQEQVQQARVMVRIISLGKCPEGFATQITRAANTQNRIERRDFAALDPEQERLRLDMLMEVKHEYSYKTGEPTPQPEHGCTIDEAAIALACSHSDPALAVQAKREVGKLYEDISRPPYKLLFNASVPAIRVWRAVELLRTVDARLRAEQELLEGRPRMVAVHGNRLVAHHVFRSLPLEGMDDPTLDFASVKGLAGEETGKVLHALVSAVASAYPTSYLNSLFKNLAKCRELGALVEAALAP